jgi:hypothetical protein
MLGGMGFVIVAIVVVLVIVVVVAVRRGAGTARARIEAGLGDLEVQRQDKANYYGQASKGEGQLRGLGTLALTPDELVFLQFVPANEVRVPLGAVSGVEIARSFLGKAQARDLLVVTWIAEGAEDRVAFDVPDVEDWRVALLARGN